jgi:glycosyltransferase involved in cell wall biosynthesis
MRDDVRGGLGTDFPRLLFVTPCAFNRVTGGGITFSNLFAGWPKDRIATAHSDPVPVDTDVCERYFVLSEDEIAPWPRFGSPRERTHVAATRRSLHANGVRPHPILRRAKRLVFGDGRPEVAHLTPALERWIADFRPQVLYTILGGNGLMALIEAIRVRFNLPTVVHFMDDWQSAIYRGGLMSWKLRSEMHANLARAVATARLRLGICEAMCEDYRERYGAPFEPFQNTIDTRRWLPYARGDAEVGSPIRIVYCGSILPYAQRESLVECCEAVGILRRQRLEIRLDIYSPPFQADPITDRLCVSDCIHVKAVLSDDEAYFRALATADVLLLPVNFDRWSMSYIRLSMPTKVPSYLVSGTPILVYGPSGVAQVEYARRCGWGEVVDRQGTGPLVAGLKRLIENKELRRRLSRRAREVAAERHDAATIRTQFQAALIRTAAPATVQ